MDRAEPLHQERPAGLVGRERERAAIDRLLDDARAQASGSLVIRGHAGIGKSALAEYAVEQAAGMTVLRTVGIAAESDLPFAGIHGLLRPVIGHLDELPSTQAAALAGALGLAPSAGADRFLVSTAVLGLLAAAAETAPVLCVIDDAQWLDRSSADALVFAARRLAAEPVAMLFGAREGDVHRFDAPGLPELILEGLDPVSAQAILAAAAGDAPATVRERLLTEARGNPLALLELPGALSAPQRRGEQALPDAIPLTPRLQGVFRARVDHLPEGTQSALLVAAADDTGEAPVVLRALTELGLGADVLDPAEDARLIATTTRTIIFRHPLVRAAIYDGATLNRRRQAHASLATALQGEGHADRRVWHQAMASLDADEEVAAALEASGRRSQLRAAHASAATAFRRAAELSADDLARARRLTAAAQAAWDAGQVDRARDAIAAARPLATGELAARLCYLRGVIEFRAGSLRRAYPALVEGSRLTEGPSFRLECLQEAAEAAAYAGEIAVVAEVFERVLTVVPVTERERFQIASASAWRAIWSGDHAAADAAFTEALARAAALDDPRALVWAANSASVSQGFGAGLRYAARAVELARTQGLLSLLPLALDCYGQELVFNSEFSLGYAAAEEGLQLSIDVGYGAGGHLANLATVEAVWGRDEDARRHADEALAIGRRSGSSLLASGAELTLGFVELSAGRSEEAFERLLELTTPQRPRTHPTIAFAAVPDLVEAAVGAGRPGDAAPPLERYRALVAAAPTDSNRALLARSEALLGSRDAEAAFAETVALGSALPPFQQARTALLYGEWLRRKRRRSDARTQLRRALELFRVVGATPWEARAEAELRATGETLRKRDPSTLDELTPQERHIASLVANGLTNRQIASQLFISPRTVDYHLRKVFSKLGIASRTELVRQSLLVQTPPERP
jgi:DNA-binding CsgD family transcriptional regulator